MDKFQSQPLDVLNKYWGYPDFRPLQLDIIQSVLNKEQVLALLPTGGGKSICYQVPGLILSGVTLVVSPLVALMKDQVDQLSQRGIKAKAVNSSMTIRDIEITLGNFLHGDYKFLYVSPERLHSDLFLNFVAQMDISLLAVDEAHCISQWGHDFRPSYTRIKEFLEYKPIDHLMALTASATTRVQKDIIEQLRFTNPRIIEGSYARARLSYSVFKQPNKKEKLLDVLKGVSGSSIIYSRSRQNTILLSEWLKKQGISSGYYHAGMASVDRNQIQKYWINNRIRVMVATNAFGMGIDKPDVRTVIHYDLPDGLESYYQEAGRAGRDGRNAFAVLLYNESDLKRQKDQVSQSYPTFQEVARVYQLLNNHFMIAMGSASKECYDLNLLELSRYFKISRNKLHNCLKRLAEYEIIYLDEDFNKKSQLMIRFSKSDLYRFQVAHVDFDALIKALLRLYGGEVLKGFMSIDEFDISKLLERPVDKTIAQLHQLNKLEVVSYQGKKQQPQLSFLIPRIDPQRLPIDKKRLESQRKKSITRASSLEKFLLEDGICRTRLIREYFGQEAYENCGICDTCLRNKKKGERYEKVDELIKKIPLVLGSSSVLLEKLEEKLSDYKPEYIHQALRVLSEERLLKVDLGKNVSLLH